MKKYFLLIILPLAFSCGANNQVDNETSKDSINTKEIVIENKICSQWSKHYECESICSTIEKNGKKTFTITVSNGKTLKLLRPDIIASRIALASYQFFRDSTENKYDKYQISVIPTVDSDSTILTYEVEQLNILEAKTKICEDFLFLLAKKKYQELLINIAPEVLEMTDEESLINTFVQLDQNYGKIISSNILGFSQPRQKKIGAKEVSLFMIKVVTVRENQNINLTFIMNMNPNDNVFYGFN